MNRIEILAPAKINLFLKILDKREDGFHSLETVFEKVSLFDKIVLKEVSSNDIVIKSNAYNSLFLDKNNTIQKAICLIKGKFRINKGVNVYIEKNIPVAAGLAGGSSDAAATLKGINRLWRLGLKNKDLIDLSKGIGSDVPLFMESGNFLLGTGKGDEVSHIKAASGLKLWHILVVPDFGISTVSAYALFDRYYLNKNTGFKNGDFQGKLRLTEPSYSAKIITYALSNRDVSLLNYYSYNSFVSVITREFPRLARLKLILKFISRDFVHLSGSGPTLFLTCSNRKEAQKLIGKIGKIVKKCHCFLVHTF